jgi:hypothetical protein
MKIKSLFVAVLLAAGVVVAPANAVDTPVVNSFKFSPQEIDLSGASTNVTFEISATHPNGFETQTTILTLAGERGNTLGGVLTRIDNPINPKLSTVIYKGTIAIPRDILIGAYSVSAASLKINGDDGFQYTTGEIISGKVRSLVGAENSLLVRNNGELNLNYPTFIGPSYDVNQNVAYKNYLKYTPTILPIWKVGEIFNPNDFYELQVPGLTLSVSSSTPLTCSSNGLELKLLKEGSCEFTVFTPKSKDYAYKKSDQIVTITSARIKPVLNLEKIPSQDVKEFPTIVAIPRVYSPTDGWALPTSLTPTVCVGAGFYVRLVNGGECKLAYQTSESTTFLASEIYTQSFEILKDGKSVVVPTPVATPTPTPVATPTAKPVVKKTITCVKGKKTVKKTAVSPKCPAGYKLKK